MNKSSCTLATAAGSVVVIDIPTLARYIQSSNCQSIVILFGAGVSVASGIPDFRSPGGLYDTLRPELLTATSQQRQRMQQDPTYVVSWDLFSQNPLPYYELRKPFILGTLRHHERNTNKTNNDDDNHQSVSSDTNAATITTTTTETTTTNTKTNTPPVWKATISHRFVELLQSKMSNKLRRLYTQNIDGLEYQCSMIPTTKIIPIHGTLAKASCEGCGYEITDYIKYATTIRTNIKDIYRNNDKVAETTTTTTNDNDDGNKDQLNDDTVKLTVTLYS